MAKIKHFDNMSSITVVSDSLLLEVRVQRELGWPPIKWTEPTTNRLRKLLKCAQSGSEIPKNLLNNPGAKVIAFVVPRKNGKSSGSMEMLRLMNGCLQVLPD